MVLEIERKFIVSTDGWKKHTSVKEVPIEQGYFDNQSNNVVRIRVTDITAYLTIKSSHKGIARDEFEYEIPHADGIELIKMCVKPVVKKTRHCVVDNFNQLWEIDIFEGMNKGLILAEIELEDEDQHIIIPDWLGKEVTNDDRYRNTSLASTIVPQE